MFQKQFDFQFNLFITFHENKNEMNILKDDLLTACFKFSIIQKFYPIKFESLNLCWLLRGGMSIKQNLMLTRFGRLLVQNLALNN